MRRPNFFIVGAPRCGTTSMYTYLQQHPEIYCSIQKEPVFFGSDLTPLAGAIKEEDLYLQLFAGAGEQPRLGESSVWYLMSKRAPYEIQEFSPGAKIIVMLRDPVKMAQSLHSLYFRLGNEDLPLDEALAAEPERREGRRLPATVYFPEGLIYTEVVRHAPNVERYFEVFGRENVHCIVFDDLVRDAAGVYRKALEFLGVDPDFEAELDPRKAAQKARFLGIRQLRRTPPEVVRRIQLDQMRLHDGPPTHPLSPELAAELRERFAEDVARLGALLGRDLSAWTSPAARVQ